MDVAIPEPHATRTLTSLSMVFTFLSIGYEDHLHRLAGTGEFDSVVDPTQWQNFADDLLGGELVVND